MGAFTNYVNKWELVGGQSIVYVHDIDGSFLIASIEAILVIDMLGSWGLGL